MRSLMLVLLCAAFAVPAVAAGTQAPAVKPPRPAGARAAAASADKALKAIDAEIAKAAVNKSDAAWRTHLPAPTVVAFDPARKYFAHVTTNKGELVLQLMPQVAPLHVTNFIYLARLGFYDGLTWHRVINQFMAQGGDPLGNGTGSPGYGFDGEFKDDVTFSRPGLLAAANAGPGTDGSQFFITFVPTTWLNGKHTIYGEVTQGMDVLAKLNADGTSDGHPKEPLSIDKVRIEVK